MSKPINPTVLEVFNSYPTVIKTKLLRIRELIYQVAAQTRGVGALEETLRWGEPSYLTTETNSGSTVRIAWKKTKPEQFAIYFNCKTSLISTFKRLYGKKLRYEGNRAIIFNPDEPLPENAISHCIRIALCYHVKK